MNGEDAVHIRRFSIGKIVCDDVSFYDAVTIIGRLISDDRPHIVLTPNIAHCRQAAITPAVAEAYSKASLSTPDGWPVVRAIRGLGATRARGRVTGSDLAPELCTLPLRVALVGGRDDSAVLAAEVLRQRNPHLVLSCTEVAPPDDLTDLERRNALVSRIANSNSDFIIVGLGVPKQEHLALDLHAVLDRGVIICAGATIDFLAGTVPRSPAWMRRIGAEWLHRMIRDPRRMVARYVLSLPYFLAMLVRAHPAENSARDVHITLPAIDDRYRAGNGSTESPV